MTNTPLVSLVVPNYNNNKFIGEFLDSVIAQNYKKWELIIIDDGSTDGSIDIINYYSHIDHRINLYTRPDSVSKGACACRNYGLNKANGDYVVFMDSDDLLPSYCLEDRINEIKERQGLDFMVFPAISFNNTPLDSKKLVLGLPIFRDDLSLFLKRYRLPFAVWTNIYRREFLIKNNVFWDENLSSLQDSDYNISMLAKGCKYDYSTIKRPNYYWRVGGNSNSITKTIKSSKNIDSQLYFYKKLYSIFSGSKYIKDVKKFGVTLLYRCLFLGKYDIPEELLSGVKWKFVILRNIFAQIAVKSERTGLILVGMFFPIRMCDELIFRVKNKFSIINYFQSIK